MSLSKWTNEQNILIKVKQQPNTVGRVQVARTAVRDMARLTLARLEQADVAQVTIDLPNGSKIVVAAE